MSSFVNFQLPSLSGSTSKFVNPLATLGALWASYQLLQIASFTWLHFLRPSSFGRYMQTSSGQEPWAIVTGASDGIGKGFAAELADRGFNVVLHGRNEKKLIGVRDDLQRRWPSRQFNILILDAVKDVRDVAKMQRAVDKLKDLPVKVLINNVGGNANEGPAFQAALDQSPANVDTCIDVSFRFPIQFTRLLLPKLIEQQPTLIINIGSGISEFAVPWLAVYSGAKAANKAWSRSLQLEMVDQGYSIEIITMIVGGVATERSGRLASLLEPSPRTIAQALFGVVGAGYSDVFAYWVHHLQFGVILSLPTMICERLILSMGRDMKAEEQAKWKKT